MKSIAFFVVLLIFVNLSLQLPKLENCPKDYEPPSSVADSCGIFTCHGPHKITGVGCATYQQNCPTGKPVEYIEGNNSLPYPDCCGGPICAE